MSKHMTRRQFLAGTSALSAVTFLGVPGMSHAEPPPEVKKVRLFHAPVTCWAAHYLAEQFLHIEGFSQIEYVSDADRTVSGPIAAVSGKVDFATWDIPHMIQLIDSGKPLLVLSGVHAGCWELIANDRVRKLHELKGKTIAIWGYGLGDHVLLSSILAYVGMDPRKDVEWLPSGVDYEANWQQFVEGKADAFMGFAPQPQLFRAKGYKGRVLVNTSQDRPWSQYFCCGLASSKEFVRANPVATKKVIRSFLKAADVCAQDPETAAHYMAERKYVPNYDMGLEVIAGLPYRRWRDSHPEDTLRFHALRLHEVGMIKSHPNDLIQKGTDFSFLEELKRELIA
jgi:NitT/TauT family transport system substrate-binding protein